MSWSFGITDLLGNSIGQIENAHERRLLLPLNGMAVASCRLGLRDALGREILDRRAKVLLKAYQDGVLRFVGDCTMAEATSRSKEGKPPGIACNFGGPMWRLAKRRTGKTDFSTSPPNTALLIAPQDLGDMIADLVDVANTESDTGVRRGTITSTVISGYGPVGYKQLAETISEIADIKVFPPETPGAWSIADNFAGVSAGLIGTSFDTGAGTWAGAGNPLDLATDGTAYRAGSSVVFDETLDRGHWAIAGTVNFTNVIVKVKVKFLEGPINARQGVFARRSGTFLGADERWINATLDPTATSQITVRKCVDGVYTTINQATLPALDSEFYPIQFQAQDDGQYFVWASNVGALAETMLVKGWDADLMTGGPLATGTAGIYDAFVYDAGLAATSNRIYEDFSVGVPSASPTIMGLEYELVPQEPVAQNGTVTIDTATDVFTLAAGHSFIANQPVTFRASTMPGGLAPGKVYYVMSTPLTGTTFKVSATAGGGSVDVTSGGTAVVVDGGVKLALLNVKPRVGQDTTEVFEWGDGNSSAQEFRWVIDRGMQMNRGYSLPTDFQPGAGGWDVKQSSDLTSMASPLDGGCGWYEDVVGDSDFSDPGLRQAYVDEEVRIRGIPREVISFEPGATSPTFGVDFAVGDTVIARAQDDGDELFNVELRVHSVEITIDENNKETMTTNLIPGE